MLKGLLRITMLPLFFRIATTAWHDGVHRNPVLGGNRLGDLRVRPAGGDRFFHRLLAKRYRAYGDEPAGQSHWAACYCELDSESTRRRSRFSGRTALLKQSDTRQLVR